MAMASSTIFHSRCEDGIALVLLECEAREILVRVIDRGFERTGVTPVMYCRARRVCSDGELGGTLASGNGALKLARGERDTRRVSSDNDQRPSCRVRANWTFERRFRPDFAQHRNRGFAHNWYSLRSASGRGDGGSSRRMHAIGSISR